MAKLGVLFSGGVLLSLLVSCGPPPRTSNPAQVNLTPSSTSTNPDCGVTPDEQDLYTHSSHSPTQIQWCAPSTATQQYFIHFTNNSGYNSPLQNGENDFAVNVVGGNACSAAKTGDPGKPKQRHYKYEVHLGNAAGTMTPTTCADPKVILK